MKGENSARESMREEETRKALQIINEAFGRCQQENIDGVVAIGIFLDHIIAHLVLMNGKPITAKFLETLAHRVREGIYDQRPVGIGQGREG